MAAGAAPAAVPAPHESSLAALPPDVVANVLTRLPPACVARAAAVSRAWHAHACDEQRVWRVICEARYGQQTAVAQWLQPAPAHPRLYRELYPVLAAHAECVGVWTRAASGPAAAGSAAKGAVFAFRWAAGGVEVVELTARHGYLTHITPSRLCMLGPAHRRHAAVVVDGSKCVLSDYGRDRRSSGAHCAAAEAAAAVAVGGPLGARGSGGGAGASSAPASGSSGVASGSSAWEGDPAGSSPGSSAAGFAAEMARFLNGTILQARGSRRRRRVGGGGGGGSGGGEVPVCVQHFSRMPGPVRAPASKAHPHQLAGLYKGLFGFHGCEMLAVSYDFSERQARIIATKLTGDANVPAGQVSWKAAAAPLPQPWPDREQQLVAARDDLVSDAASGAMMVALREAAQQPAGGVSGMQLSAAALELLLAQVLDDQPPGVVSAAALAGGVVGASDADVATEAVRHTSLQLRHLKAWILARAVRQVVAVYVGQGRTAQRGFRNAKWVDGRLWVYDDGSCGFVWQLRPGVNHLIDFERMDGDL